MNWNLPNFSDSELTLRIINGDYNALRVSVADSIAKIKETNIQSKDESGNSEKREVNAKQVPKE